MNRTHNSTRTLQHDNIMVPPRYVIDLIIVWSFVSVSPVDLVLLELLEQRCRGTVCSEMLSIWQVEWKVHVTDRVSVISIITFNVLYDYYYYTSIKYMPVYTTVFHDG